MELSWSGMMRSKYQLPLSVINELIIKGKKPTTCRVQPQERRQEMRRQGGDGGGDRVRRRGAVRPQLRQEVPHHLCDKLFGVGFYIQ